MLTATIVFLGSNSVRDARITFGRNFLPAVNKKFCVAESREDVISILDSAETDLAYVVFANVLCMDKVGRQALPGIFYDGIVVRDVLLGGRLHVIREAFKSDSPEEDSRLRLLDFESLPLSYKNETVRKQEVIVAVLSCCKYKDKRDAIRATWKPDLPDNVECLFYVGAGTCEKSNDLIQVPYADDYDNVPGKQLMFYRWLLVNYDFEWLFQVDDDTYVAPDRVTMYLDSRADMVGYMFSRQNFHGGVGYFIHRSLLTKMVNNDHMLQLRGNGDINFSRLAVLLKCNSRNVRLGTIKATGDTPVNDKRLITTHYVSTDQQVTIHTVYKDRTKWDLKAINRVAVVGTFSGKYIMMLREWYESCEKFLMPDKGKDYFIVTDADKEVVNSIIPQARVYKQDRKPRAWYFMLQRSSLLLTGVDTCQYRLVVYLQASMLFSKEQPYERLAPRDGKLWTNLVAFVNGAERYAQSSDCGAPFLKEFSHIEGNNPWPAGGMSCFRGDYVMQWATYFVDKMQECVDMGIYPAWHEEALLYRLLHDKNSVGGYFNWESGIESRDKRKYGIPDHDEFARMDNCVPC